MPRPVTFRFPTGSAMIFTNGSRTRQGPLSDGKAAIKAPVPRALRARPPVAGAAGALSRARSCSPHSRAEGWEMYFSKWASIRTAAPLWSPLRKRSDFHLPLELRHGVLEEFLVFRRPHRGGHADPFVLAVAAFPFRCFSTRHVLDLRAFLLDALDPRRPAARWSGRVSVGRQQDVRVNLLELDGRQRPLFHLHAS